MDRQAIRAIWRLHCFSRDDIVKLYIRKLSGLIDHGMHAWGMYYLGEGVGEGLVHEAGGGQVTLLVEQRAVDVEHLGATTSRAARE